MILWPLLLAVGIGHWMGPWRAIAFVACWTVAELIRNAWGRSHASSLEGRPLSQWLFRGSVWLLPAMLSLVFIDWFNNPFVTDQEKMQAEWNATHQLAGQAKHFKYLKRPWWLHEYPELNRLANTGQNPSRDSFLSMTVDDRRFGHLVIQFSGCGEMGVVASPDNAAPAPHQTISEVRIELPSGRILAFSDDDCDGIFDGRRTLASWSDEGPPLIGNDGVPIEVDGHPVHMIQCAPIYDLPEYRENYDLIEVSVGYLVNHYLNRREGEWKSPNPVNQFLGSTWMIWFPLLMIAALFYLVRRMAPHLSNQ